MDPITIGALISAGVSLIGSLISSGQEAEAQSVRQQIAAKIGAEHLPELDRQVAQEVQSSAFSGLQEDNGLRGTQLAALRGLEDEYRTGGNTKADEAANRLAAETVQRQAASNAAGLDTSLANRGVRNSGLGAALALQTQQNAGNQLGSMAQQNAIAARQRAMSALEAELSGAGGVRSQDYRKLSDVARAQDELNRFNAGQRTQTGMYNNTLSQQQFENAMARNSAQANAMNGVAAGQERAANATRQTAAGMANAALAYGAGEQDAQEKRKRGY